MSLSTDPFDYELPVERIAQRPVQPYDTARLMLIRRECQSLEDYRFLDLPQLLGPQDVLVFNNTAVLKARLFAEIVPSAAKVELLLVERLDGGTWMCLAKPMRKLKSGVVLRLSTSVIGTVQERIGDRVKITFRDPQGAELGAATVLACGNMPIPPYIRKGRADSEDERDYQTIFATHPGSIAAPTASLHFTPQLKGALLGTGCRILEITLHLSVASFQPLWDGQSTFDATAHRPAAEQLIFSKQIWSHLFELKKSGKRIVAVGTSVVRALESMAVLAGSEAPAGEVLPTDLFIQPGHKFQMVDALITNFHQPRTTHLLLVEALLGKELLQTAYQRALDSGYRFLSYGDGMLIL
ncbi:MAG: tRNA preQ1(34) S-adenosylmethionine ribosyltransferase-isomerase QueA [Oligoflexia bacterium]|nr:tRNA preQ1(34) S-adenosylmethionine ribosyltransferase-isomerase QueA [Oligoflexia bacterium]